MEPRVLQFDDWGTGDPLVLVPGGLTGWLSWMPHQERLVGRHRVVRVQPIHKAMIMVLTAYGLADLGRLPVAAAVAVGVGHLVAYAAMLGALLAAHAVGIVPRGRFASIVFVVMRALLIGLILGLIVVAALSVVPAILAVIPLKVAGVRVFPAWFETVMGLAFASLGKELAFRPRAMAT